MDDARLEMKSQIERAAAALAVFIGASSISEIKEKEPDNATDDVNGLVFLAFLIAMIGYPHGYALLTYTAINNRNEVNLGAANRFLFRWAYVLSSGSFLVAAMTRLMFGKVLRCHNSFGWAIAGSAVIGVTALKFGWQGIAWKLRRPRSSDEEMGNRSSDKETVNRDVPNAADVATKPQDSLKQPNMTEGIKPRVGSSSFQPPGLQEPTRRKVSGQSYDSGEGPKRLRLSNKPAPWVKKNSRLGSSHPPKNR
ncbi:hypothetical protein B0T26DRAFT_679285 [Lasiosphaeria miniovina]|uniref:Uncharacterized protein n=1 Tax=Lasiosphaeria miniovina TaxID=1954250 RepID=A0AA40A660_9PEZI|nr:uncharacterized protein B0T26DRAFT_679285 [Lasiosphaeria miniovina]KAK0709935.1 hypothetical protein B0T26DRAFT_679285 [Lasiosphaeria miniovina]